MDNFDDNYYLNNNKTLSDFLIKPKSFNDTNFDNICNLLDNFHLIEINVFNFLYEELFVNKNGVNLVDIVEKMKYYPSILSTNLKSLVKKNCIELFLANDSKPREIAVKFTEKGLDQIKLIRTLFLQCINCKKLYNFLALENFNDADDNYCSHNCRYKFNMEKSVQQILKHRLARKI